MSKFGAWLRLVRVAALPTALADVWLGAGVVGLLPTWDAVWLSFISVGLYGGGMILKDVRDVRSDRRDNPGRPLPLGQVSVLSAAVAGVGLLVAAVAGAAMLGRNPGAVAGVLAFLILGYNFVLKPTPLGPINMGLCRAFNVFLGMSCLPAALAHSVLPGLAAAGPIFAYITGVTYLSRSEARGGARGSLVVPSVGVVLAAAVLPVLMCVSLGIRFPLRIVFSGGLAWGVGVCLALMFIIPVVAGLWVVWKVKDVRRAVGMALVCIIPLQALAALVQLRPLAFMCIMALLVPVLLLKKFSHIT